MRIALSCFAVLVCLAAPASAGDVCLVDSPNGINGTVDCDPLNAYIHDNAIFGYSEEGYPCELGDCGDYRGWGDYQWNLSASSTDPGVYSGPLPEPIAFLYLWLTCTWLPGGFAAVEMSVATDPDLIVLAFTPLNGVLNAGTSVDLLLAVGGCPVEAFLAGEFSLLNVPPVSVDAETWGGIKAMYR
jgi:hypothetical protein